MIRNQSGFGVVSSLLSAGSMLLYCPLARAEQQPADAAPIATGTIATREIEARYSRMNEPQQLAVLNKLIASGQVDLAGILYQKLRLETQSGRTVAMFLKAKMLKAQGLYPEASRTLDELLAKDPSFASARLELAKILFLQKQDDLARKQFEFLQSSVSNADQRERIRQYVSMLDQRKNWNVRRCARKHGRLWRRARRGTLSYR